MTTFLSRSLMAATLVAFASFAYAPLASAQSLKVLEPQKNVEEFDLFDAKQGGRYIKSVDVKTLAFPIPVVEERALGFVIKLDDGRYYVGASDVVTNKVYESTALCDSTLAGPTGASRGIAGKGCN